jgi:hypothetical protein
MKIKDKKLQRLSKQISQIQSIAKSTKLGIYTQRTDERIKVDELFFVLNAIEDISSNMKRDIFKVYG